MRDGIYERLVKLNDDWATKNGNASLQEEMRKVVLAEMINQSSASSHGAKETDALTSQRYRDHLKMMVTLRTEANIAKGKLEAAKIHLEHMRTKEVTERSLTRHAT